MGIGEIRRSNALETTAERGRHMKKPAHLAIFLLL
jgi:hypothetical protein